MAMKVKMRLAAKELTTNELANKWSRKQTAQSIGAELKRDNLTEKPWASFGNCDFRVYFNMRPL